MDLTVKKVGIENVLFCKPCDCQLQVGYNLIGYCPKCQACMRGTQAVATLCCKVCEKPMALTQDDGLYCTRCMRQPAIQHTYYINEPD